MLQNEKVIKNFLGSFDGDGYSISSRNGILYSGRNAMAFMSDARLYEFDNSGYNVIGEYQTFIADSSMNKFRHPTTMTC
jgi:hypothetical protein